MSLLIIWKGKFLDGTLSITHDAESSTLYFIVESFDFIYAAKEYITVAPDSAGIDEMINKLEINYLNFIMKDRTKSCAPLN